MAIIVNYIFKFFIAICVSICAAMPLLAVEPIDDTAQAVDTEQVQSELSEEHFVCTVGNLEINVDFCLTLDV